MSGLGIAMKREPNGSGIVGLVIHIKKVRVPGFDKKIDISTYDSQKDDADEQVYVFCYGWREHFFPGSESVYSDLGKTNIRVMYCLRQKETPVTKIRQSLYSR